MIKLFEKVISEHATAHLTDGNFCLSYLKFSTVTSGSGMNDKVIFLVFKKNAHRPFLCLKTVRNYGAKHAVVRNFQNLQKLNTLTAGSPGEDLFSRAVYLHDDGENVFSIETACQGSRIGKDVQKLMTVVEKYTMFQMHVAKQSKPHRSMQELASETIVKSGLNESDQRIILEYFEKLLPVDIKLPRIIQHGDLTPDNILWSRYGACIVDYDDVGNTDIPGYDLFNLLRRFSPIDFLKLRREYFPLYFRKIGVNFTADKYERLMFLYHFVEYIQKKSHNFEEISIKKIISNFESLRSKTER